MVEPGLEQGGDLVDALDVVAAIAPGAAGGSARVTRPFSSYPRSACWLTPVSSAWRGHVSGKRFVHVTAVNGSNPVHGRVTAALRADQHMRFWKELIPEGDLEPGDERTITVGELAQAWEAMPVDLPDAPPDRDEEEI